MEKSADDRGPGASRERMESAPRPKEPTWFVVIHGDERGPFTLEAIRALLAEATIDREAPVRRDGADVVVPLEADPELLALADEEAVPVSVPCPPEDDLLADALPPLPIPAMPLEGALFTARPSVAPVASEPPRRESNARPLFALPRSDRVARTPRVVAPTPAPEVPAPEPVEAPSPTSDAAPPPATDSEPPRGFTGQRNENSVLFSEATRLQMLKAAEDARRHHVEPPADPSGLIDISRLAKVMEASGTAKRTDRSEEILTVAAPSALSSIPPARPNLEPVATPAVVPPPPPLPSTAPGPSSGINKTVVLSATIVALIVTAGIGSIQVILHRSQPAPATTGVTTGPEPLPPAQPPGRPESLGSTPAPAVTPPSPSPAPTGSVALQPPSPQPPSPQPPSPQPPHRAPTGTAEPAHRSTPRVARTPSEPRPSRSVEPPTTPATRPVRPVQPPTTNTGDGDLPETPSRGDVVSAMSLVAPIVRACGNGVGGRATVDVIFASSGRVTTSTVRVPFSGTPTGSCVARAVRGVRIPAFRRPNLQVTYAFDL